MRLRRAAAYLLKLSLTIVLGGMLAATLVRVAPGFGVDERELDPRLREESRQAIRNARAGETDILHFYASYLGGLVKGDLGFSRSLNRPVTQLLAERLPVTFRTVTIGLGLGWALGLALATVAAASRSPRWDFATSLLSGTFLCIPSAVLALLFLFSGGPAAFAIALVVFPRVFRYARNLLVDSYNLQHVLMARAKGLGEARILLWHVLPSAAAPILALAGVSVSLAFGAAIPIEVICDSPGIGQLAWLAAMGRDLPLLVNLTVLVTAVTIVANSAADLATSAWSGANGAAR